MYNIPKIEKKNHLKKRKKEDAFSKYEQNNLSYKPEEEKLRLFIFKNVTNIE